MTGSNDKTIRIWDPATGECKKILKGHKDLVRTLCYDPLRQRIFSGSYDKRQVVGAISIARFTPRY